MTRLLTHALAFAAGTVAAACLLDSRRAARPGNDAAAERHGVEDIPTTASAAGVADDTDNARLVAAVRAALDRNGLGGSIDVQAEEGCIDVQAEEGCIVATGHIVDARRDAALRAIRAVPGVREVHDHLQPSARAQAAPGEPWLEPSPPSRETDS
ncbi:BON domain-containing protein [Lysobacter yananisis]|uniref:BON domain-containing protein n=1 Tax=Lysobacter yananisis TaxID=1003114 RepID=A0ABY9PCJ9_9GAMM|nr:BON domain-containing protein [Lysobacter yananisis]WMT04138.1 BON domain-containing protein [Lysobacter yananisis]